jgi:hypothetical protein
MGERAEEEGKRKKLKRKIMKRKGRILIRGFHPRSM